MINNTLGLSRERQRNYGVRVRAEENVENLIAADVTPLDGTDPAPIEGCFALTKVYDWTKLTSDHDFPFAVPPADLILIEDAIAAGHIISYVGDIPLDQVETKIVKIIRADATDKCPCIVLQKTTTIHIVITDVTTGKVLSDFMRQSQFFDSTKVCLPLPLDASNIDITITESEAIVLSLAPFEGLIMVEISLCQEIKVKLEVLARMEILGYCPPKKGIPCLGSVPCKTTCDQGIPPAGCTDCGVPCTVVTV